MTTYVTKRGQKLIRNSYFTITSKNPPEVDSSEGDIFCCKIISWDDDLKPFLVGAGYGPSRPLSQKPARLDSHKNGYASLCIDEMRKREVAKLGVNINVKGTL